jgi:hypothetical protein
MLTKEDEINKKILIVKEILNNVYEILNIFKPLLSKMLKMEDAEQYKQDGSLERAASLFGEISELCKEIEKNHNPSDLFLENLGN